MTKRNVAMVAAVALVVVCAGSAMAATINVATWADLVAATPSSGDVVQFAAGTYTVTAQVEVVGGRNLSR